MAAALESLIVVIAVGAAAAPWLTSKLSGRVIGAAFGVLLALLATAAALALDLYPWSVVLVIGVALAGGVGLGRLMPSRFLAWLQLLVALSILDIAQVALTSGSPTPGPGSAHGPVLGQYLNLRVQLPWGHASIGIFDLLLVTGIGELWRRTGAPLWSASLTALVGLIAADIFAALSGMRGLALTPFITLGWLVVAGTGQLRKRRTLPGGR